MIRLTKFNNAAVRILVPSQMAVRLQQSELRPMTPWQKVDIRGETVTQVMEELDKLFLYVDRNKVYDCNSDRSLGIEATFFKAIRKKDKKNISKIENPNLLTNRNFMMYGRGRLLNDTSTIFQLATGKNYTRKKLENALFLNPGSSCLMFFENSMREEVEGKITSVGRNFTGYQETVGLVSNRKQLEFLVGKVLDNDSFYIQPMNLQDVGSRASFYTEDYIKKLGKYGVGFLVFLVLLKNSVFDTA